MIRGVFLAWVLLSGCAPVKPWQRELLTHPSMDPSAGDRITAEDFYLHCFDVREGATGGAGRPGGGCGCN